MAIVRAVLVTALLVLGAAGLSSLEDDDYCSGMAASELWSLSHELALWPPGLRCVATHPDGSTTAIQSGSAPSFLVLLAGLLAVGAWKLRQRERARIAFAVALAFAVSGAAGLEGAWQGSVMAGLALGVPLALVAGGWTAAVAATAALLVAELLHLFGLGPAAFLLPLALVALVSPTGRVRR